MSCSTKGSMRCSTQQGEGRYLATLLRKKKSAGPRCREEGSRKARDLKIRCPLHSIAKEKRLPRGKETPRENAWPILQPLKHGRLAWGRGNPLKSSKKKGLRGPTQEPQKLYQREETGKKGIQVKKGERAGWSKSGFLQKPKRNHGFYCDAEKGKEGPEPWPAKKKEDIFAEKGGVVHPWTRSSDGRCAGKKGGLKIGWAPRKQRLGEGKRRVLTTFMGAVRPHRERGGRDLRGNGRRGMKTMRGTKFGEPSLFLFSGKKAT